MRSTEGRLGAPTAAGKIEPRGSFRRSPPAGHPDTPPGGLVDGRRLALKRIVVNPVSHQLSIRNRQLTRRLDCRFLARLTRFLLRDLMQKPSYELAIYLVGGPEITQLNETFLQHHGPTDVITFDYCDPAQPESLSGEVFVCLDEAERQARLFHASWQSETVRYVVHGILHLCGYDDHKPGDRRKMKREEDRLVRELSRRFAFPQLG